MPMEFEAEKLNLERRKFELERRKVELDSKRARWLAVSVAVPLFAALATVAYGFWSTQTQAQYQFRLEAAKAIMGAPSPYEAMDRAAMFKYIFPNDLPETFTRSAQGGVNPIEANAKKELFRAMASRDMTAKQVLELWVALFPHDTWAQSSEVQRSVVNSAPR